jgi:hypothetical protein
MGALEGWRWVGRRVLYGKSICSSQCGQQSEVATSIRNGVEDKANSCDGLDIFELTPFCWKTRFFPFLQQFKMNVSISSSLSRCIEASNACMTHGWEQWGIKSFTFACTQQNPCLSYTLVLGSTRILCFVLTPIQSKMQQIAQRGKHNYKNEKASEITLINFLLW